MLLYASEESELTMSGKNCMTIDTNILVLLLC